jgi:ABC-type multidrug transport system ATPase subunit
MLGAEMVYFRMTGIDNLKFFSRLYRIKNSSQKIKDITTNLGIYNKLGEYVSSYSRGQKLRIALARVLLIEPEILFLDEPLLGLDPKTTRDLISILLKLNKTILLTSHQMHIVEQLCGRIAFLNNGKVIKIDTQENYKKLISEFIRISFDIFEKDKKTELEKELNSLNYVKNISKRKDGFLITISDNKYYPDLLTNLGKYPIQRVQEIEPSLDDVFVELS